MTGDVLFAWPAPRIPRPSETPRCPLIRCSSDSLTRPLPSRPCGPAVRLVSLEGFLMGQAYTFSQMPESVASWAAQQQPFVSEYIPPRPLRARCFFTYQSVAPLPSLNSLFSISTIALFVTHSSQRHHSRLDYPLYPLTRLSLHPATELDPPRNYQRPTWVSPTAWSSSSLSSSQALS
jgi:hypothetical protein